MRVWIKRSITVVLPLGVLAAVVMSVAHRSKPSLPPDRQEDPASLRQTQAGPVVGFRENSHNGWLGVPYAKAERWRAPLPPLPWSGTRKALTMGEPCYQFRRTGVAGAAMNIPKELWGKPVGSEDCLTLNIRAPVNIAPGEHLPVMLWIPGGANTIGHGELYDFSAFVERERIIVVTVNYRLGIFGWFSHPAMQSGSELDRSANYGLLDIIAALRWVRDDIANFGGDPNNVTLFGVSTGGSNTIALLMSPLARGLFQKAIVQSGPMWHDTLAAAQNYVDDVVPGHANSSRELVIRLLIADGRARDRTEAKSLQDGMSPKELEAYLRGKTAEQLTAPLAPDNISGMYQIPNLIQDGIVLPAKPFATMLEFPQEYNAVPIIFGSNHDEMKFFMMMDPRLIKVSMKYFYRARNPAGYDRESSYRAAAWRESTVVEPAREVSAHGGTVYAYRFDWDEHPSNIMVDLKELLGAGHSLETAFVSGQFKNFLGLPFVFRRDPDEKSRDELSSAMMSYWAEFAYTSSPGRGRDGKLPEWERFEPTGRKSIIFATARGGNIRMESEPEVGNQLKQQLARDVLFQPHDRCKMYVEMYAFPINAPWRDSEYSALGCSNESIAQLMDESNLRFGSSRR